MIADDCPLDCVAFLLIRDGRVLLERRSPTKRVVPGVLAIPGGHMEGSESAEEAVRRELEEELGVTAATISYVCTLLHRAQEFRRLHYFAVTAWEGEMIAREADGLQWTDMRCAPAFDLDVDRLAVSEYLRVYRTGKDR
ncbi:MAG TPA: NUDIX domain-containing protein [Propionibacteriaceae bacterium]|nr:NUDIX domain-containing protein [Propionibacteriaceae bacterium]